MKKAGCIILAVAMLLGVASCNKRGDDLSKAKKVPDNGTWWNDTITEISGEELWKEFDNKAFQVFNKYLYADEESVILCFSASINKPGDEYYRESFLRHYSYDGKLLGQVNIGDSFAEGTEYAYKASIYKQNGKYYTFAYIYDNEKK